jgi:DNA transposition AAA+ family ATPase
MRYRVVPVKNVSRLITAGDALLNRATGLPGIGLIWGPTGYGKTTAAAWFVNQCHGVYVRAMRMWAPKTMLTSIARELDIDVQGLHNAEMVDHIIRRLADTGRPLFIDEADYVVELRRLTDTLRDIHDMSSSPIILIGMHGVQKKIRGNEQFTGRIAQWVEFAGADLNDAHLLANTLAEVKIENDLLARLHAAASPKGHAEAGAEIRRFVVGLSQIEQYARARGMDRIGLAEWSRGDQFFIDSPVTPPLSSAPVIPLRPEREE